MFKKEQRCRELPLSSPRHVTLILVYPDVGPYCVYILSEIQQFLSATSMYGAGGGGGVGGLQLPSLEKISDYSGKKDTVENILLLQLS